MAQTTSGHYLRFVAGSLDRPTGLEASSHIHVHMAADYYDIDDGLPSYADDYPSFYFPGDLE